MLDVNPQNSAKDKWFLIFLYIYHEDKYSIYVIV